jgi:hypothetical protein
MSFEELDDCFLWRCDERGCDREVIFPPHDFFDVWRSYAQGAGPSISSKRLVGKIGGALGTTIACAVETNIAQT